MGKRKLKEGFATLEDVINDIASNNSDFSVSQIKEVVNYLNSHIFFELVDSNVCKSFLLDGLGLMTVNSINLSSKKRKIRKTRGFNNKAYSKIDNFYKEIEKESKFFTKYMKEKNIKNFAIPYGLFNGFNNRDTKIASKIRSGNVLPHNINDSARTEFQNKISEEYNNR